MLFLIAELDIPSLFLQFVLKTALWKFQIVLIVSNYPNQPFLVLLLCFDLISKDLRQIAFVAQQITTKNFHSPLKSSCKF